MSTSVCCWLYSVIGTDKTVQYEVTDAEETVHSPVVVADSEEVAQSMMVGLYNVADEVVHCGMAGLCIVADCDVVVQDGMADSYTYVVHT